MKKELQKVLNVLEELEPLRIKYKVDELTLSFSLSNIIYSITKDNLIVVDSKGTKLYNIEEYYRPKGYFKPKDGWVLVKKQLRQSTEEQIKDLVIKQNFYYPVCDPYEL